MVSKLTRVIIGSLLLVGLVFAQQGNTIFATVVTGQAANGNFVVPAQYMIGQSGHQVFVAIGNNGSHTCTPSTGVYATAQLQGSYDGTGWTNMSNPIVTGLSGTGVGSAQGVYPFVRLAATNTSTTNCQYALYYGAGISTVTSAPQTLSGGTFNNPVGTYNNQAQVVEKGNRFSTYANTVNSATSVTLGLGGAATDSVIVDCIHASLLVTTGTMAAGGWYQTIASSYLQQGSFGLWIAMPAGAPAGTLVTRDVCGLNLFVGYVANNPTVFIGGSGASNLAQTLNVTWYLVSH